MSFSFDMSWEELLWLVEGHHVHVADEELRRDGRALVAYCAAHRVDVVNLTPTYAQALLDEGLLDGDHRPCLVLLGGEAVSEKLWAVLRDTDGVARLQPLRPHRIHDQHPGRRHVRQPHRDRRLSRSGTPPATSWTAGCARCRPASPGSCTSPAPGWPAGT
nr:hypothetical protein GCM10020092_091450 [Actinoplanes digitatis]